jgi:hypothetical protein
MGAYHVDGLVERVGVALDVGAQRMVVLPALGPHVASLVVLPAALVIPRHADPLVAAHAGARKLCATGGDVTPTSAPATDEKKITKKINKWATYLKVCFFIITKFRIIYCKYATYNKI